VRNILFLVLSVAFTVLVAGFVARFVIAQRLEREITLALREQNLPGEVTAAPILGVVTVEPFEWETPDGTLTIKSSTLRATVSPREAAEAIRTTEARRLSRVHLTLEYSIVTTLLTPEPLYIPDLEILFQRDPAPTIVFNGRSEGLTIVLPEELGSIQVRDFQVTVDLPDTFTVDEIPETIVPVGVRATLRDGQFIAGPGLRREIDHRREGLGEIFPVRGLPFSTITLDARSRRDRDSDERHRGLLFDIERTRIESPVLRAEASGTVTLAADGGLDAAAVRITVSHMADSLRPTVVPLVYAATGGSMVPRDGPFTLTADIHHGSSPVIILE
jgi:hypothetical protein